VCVGKTTACNILADRHTLRVYDLDREEPFHTYGSVPERRPHHIAFMTITIDRSMRLLSSCQWCVPITSNKRCADAREAGSGESMGRKRRAPYQLTHAPGMFPLCTP
jgi:hypothetical protein